MSQKLHFTLTYDHLIEAHQITGIRMSNKTLTLVVIIALIFVGVAIYLQNGINKNDIFTFLIVVIFCVSVVIIFRKQADSRIRNDKNTNTQSCIEYDDKMFVRSNQYFHENHFYDEVKSISRGKTVYVIMMKNGIGVILPMTPETNIFVSNYIEKLPNK